eukprot:gnl/TRDRNA2_/TRDRNA2_175417_c5_seq2.p1 gnl/TRDRNA2_/TRDRNA2_175417_c5~~gnl/TRDRNA2_/TRDRNA2_175417_c5_seq2.p1  ORF type:complete len:335 (-),score=67.16 gnl/TRDRNA2_/TRDRNA2_175417_c5_seq2:525-1421(-)
MVAAVIVNLITLVGVILAVPAVSRFAARSDAFSGVLWAFAAGAILACAFFLLLFEATHLIAAGWDEEVEVLWRWGVMVLAGFILPAVIDGAGLFVLEATMKIPDPVCQEEASPGREEAIKAQDVVLVVENRRKKVRMISAVTVGDFFHNLCDGFFIGAAFKGCGSSFGWGVAVATVLHELPQELADYAVLTGKGVEMTTVQALLINFLTGLSVVLGVIIINASEVDTAAVGLLLSFGGGVYVYIAAVECMPKVHELKLSARTNLLCLLAFTLGAVLIGLILLDHEHCVPDDGSGGHAH